ncbi:MAG: hypothetical protein U0930_02695 [Pirellulales bacterium]
MGYVDGVAVPPACTVPIQLEYSRKKPTGQAPQIVAASALLIPGRRHFLFKTVQKGRMGGIAVNLPCSLNCFHLHAAEAIVV